MSDKEHYGRLQSLLREGLSELGRALDQGELSDGEALDQLERMMRAVQEQGRNRAPGAESAYKDLQRLHAALLSDGAESQTWASEWLQVVPKYLLFG